MKTLLKIALVLAVLAGVTAAAYQPAMRYWKQRNAPKWRTAEVSTGDIVFEVNATGTVKPVLSVMVGSFVSGPIQECLVDFNDDVTKGQVLAVVDKRIYEANVARDRANLETRKADVIRAKAQWQQAVNDEQRALKLQAINEQYIAQAELDQYRFARESLEAQVTVAEMAVEQAEASLLNSQTNLDFCEIVSPVDGIVIDRKIDPGQTLASTFQTPELFVVAPDLRKEIHIYAQIDESDIGLVRDAYEREEPVRFQVDAYPDEVYVGKTRQIRLSSATNQNVVTYPVVVAAPNPELKLLPGMTATLSFQIEEQKEVARIPNAALRFYPEVRYVREEDKKILEGAGITPTEPDEESETTTLSVSDRAEAHRERNRRHVWVAEGEKLRAVEVVTGISDNRYTQLVSGEIKPGDVLVTGLEGK